MNGRHDRLSPLPAQELVKLSVGAAFFSDLDRIREPAIPEGLADLIIEVNAVGDDKDDRVFEFFLFSPELHRRKKHGERFARSLPVPDDAPLFLFRGHSFQDFVYGRELLIAADLLDRPGLLLLIDNKIPDDIEKVLPA